MLVQMLASISLLVTSTAQRAEHSATPTNPPGNLGIKITISPEARVSVTRTGDMPPSVACGNALEVPVLIVNQSAVSFELQASLVYPVLNSIELEFSAERLRGVAEERRVLKVIMHAPGIVDITVAFRPKNDMSDLGGRDQTHFLLRCA